MIRPRLPLIAAGVALATLTLAGCSNPNRSSESPHGSTSSSSSSTSHEEKGDTFTPAPVPQGENAHGEKLPSYGVGGHVNDPKVDELINPPKAPEH